IFHSVPNGDPPAPIGSNTKFVGAVLAPPVLVPKEFWRFRFHPELTINFLAVMPLYVEEMNLKLEKGGEELFARLEKAQITEMVDIHRKNMAKKRFGLF